MVSVCSHARELGLDVLVVTSKRHYGEPLYRGGSLKDALQELGLEHVVITDLTEFDVIQFDPEHTLAMSYGAAWIFKEAFIALFNGKFVNIHSTRLPQHRGGGGVSWRILSGEKRGAQTVHMLTPEVDAGVILKYNEYLFPTECRIPADYYRYIVNVDARFVSEFITEMSHGKAFEILTQQETFSSYFPRLNTLQHGFIDWSWSAADVVKFICAFDSPYAGAQTTLNGEPVHVKGAHMMEAEGTHHPFQCGLVYRVTDHGAYVAAKDGAVLVTTITNGQGESINMGKLVGKRLHTSRENLDRAMGYVASYGAE